MRATALAGGFLAALLAVSALFASSALGAGPPPLSGDRGLPDLSARYGSGDFGRWGVDRFGLPAYSYTIDPATAPQAHQSELKGSTDAWHQLGNDYLVADAHNEGYVQLWSQARAYQWINRYESGAGHYAGGYGYLRLPGRTISTLYADRPAGARTSRDFGSGYFHRRTAAKPVAIDENVYAPFGDAPLLLHDVTIRNTSHRRLRADWVEYWDVNPYDEYRDTHLGLASPGFSKRGRTLSVAQTPDEVDSSPTSIFAAALRGRVRGWETNGAAFFGGGGRAAPAEVTAGSLGQSIAPPVAEGKAGSTMLAMRSPVNLRPGQSVTLRYGYGTAHAKEIPHIVARWQRADAPFAHSQRAWANWVPRASFSGHNGWLSRELAWDGYALRSGATFDEACGHHIVSQGGYYQYDFGWQAAYRDPLQHALPLIYSDPEMAREILRYSAQEQNRSSGEIPYSIGEMCRPIAKQGTSDDLDLWLLWTAAEYGLASRDLDFFDEKLSWRDGGSSTLWKHLVRAFSHQESFRGPHGGYLTTGTNGDWSDLSTTVLGMTESTLVTAQVAYIYPRLADLADARGARGFARRLRAAAARDREVMRNQWTGRGWYARGYAGDQQLGAGAIYGEPQPWAVLAGVPTRGQARALVGNVRRFLTGIGAPPELHGPAPIGSSQSPARNDPDVTERSFPGLSPNNAVFPGGAWYSVNGWLTLALAHLAGTVPHARADAFAELRRNTLAAHAHAYPDHWNGVLSVDDVCYAYYESEPSRCGIGFSTLYDTQIMHQPAWSLFDTITLAGLEPTRGGYRIDPKLPMRSFSLRLPRAGVAYSPGLARGYLRPAGHDRLKMVVTLPAGLHGGDVAAFVDGRRAAVKVAHGTARFSLRADGGKPTDWALTA
jgi:Glycosyl hydrolase 36 superfamily, catalytic domain/Glycosyltransferase family 36